MKKYYAQTTPQQSDCSTTTENQAEHFENVRNLAEIAGVLKHVVSVCEVASDHHENYRGLAEQLNEAQHNLEEMVKAYKKACLKDCCPKCGGVQELPPESDKKAYRRWEKLREMAAWGGLFERAA